MSHSRFLRDRIALFSGGRGEVAASFWSSPDLAALYPELLVHAYAVVRASVPLMETARQEALRRGDPVSLGVAAYLAKHIPEETGHDLWMREDLALLGVSAERLDDAPPSALAATMVGAQYFWIRHAHPVSILGYLAVLEGDPPDPAFYASAALRSGLPTAAFRTYALHAQLDPEHRDDLFGCIDQLPLEDRHLQLLSHSALHSCQSLENTLRTLLASHQARQRAAG